MAVTNSSNKSTSAGNGVATQFSLSAKCFSLADVKVYQKIAGVETEVTIGITKTAISGSLENGVLVTFGTPPASGTEITLIRELDATQPLELEVGGNLPANELEDALDRNTMLSQQLEEKLARCITVPPSDPVGLNYEASTVEQRAGKAIGFDGDGNVILINISAEDGGISSVNTSAGLLLDGGIISGKADESTVTFDGSGNFSVKDAGITSVKLATSLDMSSKTVTLPAECITLGMMATLANLKLIGNVSGGNAVPSAVAIIDDDAMITATATNIPTAESVKAYVLNSVYPRPISLSTDSISLINGIIIKFGYFDIDSGVTSVAKTFPVAFGTACYAFVPIRFASTLQTVSISAIAKTGVTLKLSSIAEATKVYYVAVGY